MFDRNIPMSSRPGRPDVEAGGFPHIAPPRTGYGQRPETVAGRKSRRAGHLRSLVSGATFALASLMAGQASAQTSVVGACSGVSLPRSAVTNLIGSVLVPVLGPAESLLRPLTGNLLSLNIAPTLASTAAGAPITLNALDINGNEITVAGAGQCIQQADGFQLTTPKGLSIGGGRITGLGSGTTLATAAELGAIAFGNGAATASGATGAVALGAGASVGGLAPGSVALGQNSAATGATLGTGAYLVGGTAQGEVAIGNRRLTGLAAGAVDTDAVNVAQLRAATVGLGPVDALLFDTAAGTYSALRGTASTRIAGVADGTIAVGSNDAVNGGQLAATNAAVATNAANITNVGTAVTGLQADALLFNATAGTYTALRGGASTRIAGVADGTIAVGSNDAVNGGQLAATNAAVATNATNITNVGTAVTGLQADALLFNATTGTYAALRNGSSTRVSGVADGTIALGSNEAVNGGQLAATNAAVATNATNITNVGTAVSGLQADALLFNATTGTYAALRNGTSTRVSGVADGTIAVGSNEAVNGGQLATTNAAVATNAANITNVGTAVTGLQADALLFNATAGTYTALRGGASTRIAGVADGSIAVGSNDAVNGGQLAATNAAVTTNATNITNVGTAVSGLQTDALLFNATTGTYAALRNGTSTRVSGVADGTIALGSNDAVNGGQLAATNAAVATNATSITNVGTAVTGLQADALLFNATTGTYAALRNGASTRIASVADGSIAVGSNDAVNGGQLAATNAAVATNATNITNVGTAITGLQADALLYDQAASAFNATRGGGSTRVIGVADGTIAVGSNEAVNGGQLATTNAAVATNATSITNVGTAVTGLQADSLLFNATAGTYTALRGGASARIAGVADGTIAVGSNDAVNGGQLATTNAAVATNTTNITNVGTALSGLQADALLYDHAAGAFNAARGGAAAKIFNVGAATLSATSTDAVNGTQLFATNQQVGTNTTDITNLTTAIANGTADPLAVRYADTTRGTLVLGGATGTVVGNVAAGTVSAVSSDAINGTQLFALGNGVAGALGGGSAYDPATGRVNAGILYGGTTYDSVQGAVSAIQSELSEESTTGRGRRYFHANSTMPDSAATGIDSIAIGPSAKATADGSIAAGRNTSALGAGSVAIGDGASATTGKAVAIGFANIASGDGAVSIGDPNIATGNGAVTLGRDNQATGTGAVALGDTNFATGDASVSIGGNNNAIGAGAVTIGTANVLNGANAVVIGTGNIVNGAQATAIGDNNRLTGDQSLAFGSNIVASGNDTLAVGNSTVASGDSAAAFGNEAVASGLRSAALGSGATASGFFSTATGQGSLATGFASTAVGTTSVASALGSTAIGAGASASAADSVALGGASAATRGGLIAYTAFGLAAPQTTIGEVAIARSAAFINPVTGLPLGGGDRQITGVGAGSENTDAVNVAQLRGASSMFGTAYASGLGGGAAYDAATGAVTGPRYVINGTTYTNVGDALAGVSGSGSQVASTAVSYDTTTRDVVTLAGAAGTKLSNVAAGTVTATSTDAVNGAQLAATNRSVASLGASTAAGLGGGSVTNADGSVTVPVYRVTTVAAGGTPATATYGDVGSALTGLGSSIANVNTRINTINTVSDRAVTYDGATGTVRDTITLAGANGTRLTNVTPGAVNATSTDAVNGAQLNAVGRQVATNTTSIASLQAGTAGYFQANNAAGTPTPVASGTNAVAGGGGAVSSGANSTALGTAASATAANSVALGAGSVADRADSVSVGNAAGNRQITNVAAGISPTDAANIGQINTGLNQALAQANAYTDMRVDQLRFDLKDVRREANAGTAAAMALATIPQAYGPGMGMVGGGVSTWNGQRAFAIGVSKASADGTFVLKAGATLNTRGDGGGAVGGGFAF